MKNNTSIIIIFFCLFFLRACSDNREENTHKKLVTATTLLLPSDKQICMEMPITFSWKSVTNATSYNLTVNKVENGKETTVFTESTSNTNYSFNNLEKGILYKWKVETIGPQNSMMSSTFQFQTESLAITNHTPFAPELISPTLGSTIVDNSVSWKCEDLDNDPLTYDLYLGTDINNLRLTESNLTSTNYKFKELVANTKYYWKIIAKDNHSNVSIGQVWSFITS